jgi:hypothetical protein
VRDLIAPGDKLTGDFGNEPDATSISDRGSRLTPVTSAVAFALGSVLPNRVFKSLRCSGRPSPVASVLRQRRETRPRFSKLILWPKHTEAGESSHPVQPHGEDSIAPLAKLRNESSRLSNTRLDGRTSRGMKSPNAVPQETSAAVWRVSRCPFR